MWAVALFVALATLGRVAPVLAQRADGRGPERRATPVLAQRPDGRGSERRATPALAQRPDGRGSERRATPAHLFVDDRWIASTYQVVRVVPEPLKDPANPVIVADRPWEGKNVYVYGTVLHDEGRYRMWYQVFNLETTDPLFRTAVGYAESDDGIRWVKPELGIVFWNGRSTNLVLRNHGTSDLASLAVVKTPDDPDPGRRYKMLYWDAMGKEDLERLGANFPLGETMPGWTAIPGEGFFTATSPDGIHWSNTSPQPVFTCTCDALSMSRTDDGMYRAWFKISTAPDRHFRVLGVAESRDFVHWSEPSVALEPDWRDPFGEEFYGMSAFDYAGQTIGLLWMYHDVPSDKSLDLQLATRAADGSWQRAADRRTLLDTGPPGAFDSGALFTAASDVLVEPPGHEGEMWLYYGGSTVHHDDRKYRETSIGLARLRVDGFAAMEAGQFDGLLETNPVRATGPTLVVNVEALHGYVQAEAVDPASGRVLAASARLERVDDTALELPWESGSLPPGSGIVLRFRMSRARLYSFRFDP